MEQIQICSETKEKLKIVINNNNKYYGRSRPYGSKVTKSENIKDKKKKGGVSQKDPPPPPTFSILLYGACMSPTVRKEGKTHNYLTF